MADLQQTFAESVLLSKLTAERRLLKNAQDELASARGEVAAWTEEVASQARNVAELKRKAA